MAVRQQAQSIRSGDTASRPKGSQSLAAVERYLHEEDRYKEFLINGTQRRPYLQQVSKQPVECSYENKVKNQGWRRQKLVKANPE